MTDAHKTTLVRVDDSRAIAATPMHPLVAAAMQAGGQLDPSTMERFLNMQERWEANEARKAFTRDLTALKRDLPTVIARDATVDFTSSKGRTHYTHASLAGVMDAITGPLTAHGFSLSWNPSTPDRMVRVTCRLVHREGHSEEATMESPADTSGNKNPAQAQMSTVTLLSRYTALSLLGIATADMKEPTGKEAAKPAPDHIDAKKNLTAASAIVEAGLKREDAEKHIGRKVSAWTAADREELRGWFKANRPTPEPTHDPSTGELSAEEEARMAGES